MSTEKVTVERLRKRLKALPTWEVPIYGDRPGELLIRLDEAEAALSSDVLEGGEGSSAGGERSRPYIEECGCDAPAIVRDDGTCSACGGQVVALTDQKGADRGGAAMTDEQIAALKNIVEGIERLGTYELLSVGLRGRQVEEARAAYQALVEQEAKADHA
jgi:hypothetical protein